jgi:hypothetical protein
MHDPHPNPSTIVKPHIDPDRGVPNVIRAHAIDTAHHIQSALVTLLIREDRDTCQRGAILPSGELDPAVKQLSRAPCIGGQPEEIEVATDHLRHCDVAAQAAPELAEPHCNRLPSYEDDMPLADHGLDTPKDPLHLS